MRLNRFKAGSTQRYYITGGVRRKGKTGKHGKVKSRNEEKVVGFSSASLFPVRKWEAITQGRIIESGG